MQETRVQSPVEAQNFSVHWNSFLHLALWDSSTHCLFGRKCEDMLSLEGVNVMADNYSDLAVMTLTQNARDWGLILRWGENFSVHRKPLLHLITFEDKKVNYEYTHCCLRGTQELTSWYQCQLHNLYQEADSTDAKQFSAALYIFKLFTRHNFMAQIVESVCA